MTLKFGHERRHWDAAKAAVVAILGERVQSGRGPMTYGELAAKVKAISLEPHQYAMSAILGEVSDDEDSVGRGRLSAYGVTAETGPSRSSSQGRRWPAGMVMGWARSLGEFGATIKFAANVRPCVPAFDDRSDARIGWFASRLGGLAQARADDRFSQ